MTVVVTIVAMLAAAALGVALVSLIEPWRRRRPGYSGPEPLGGQGRSLKRGTAVGFALAACAGMLAADDGAGHALVMTGVALAGVAALIAVVLFAERA